MFDKILKGIGVLMLPVVVPYFIYHVSINTIDVIQVNKQILKISVDIAYLPFAVLISIFYLAAVIGYVTKKLDVIIEYRRKYISKNIVIYIALITVVLLGITKPLLTSYVERHGYELKEVIRGDRPWRPDTDIYVKKP